MKILICILFFFIPINAQKLDPELVRLRDDYIKATKDYKASLERLLAIYEANVKKADEKLANVKKLFDEGLISPSQMEEDERLVKTAHEKVSETRKQMENADTQIADILTDAELAQEYKKAVEQRRRTKPRTPCHNWQLTAYRRETKGSITIGYKLICDK